MVRRELLGIFHCCHQLVGERARRDKGIPASHGAGAVLLQGRLDRRRFRKRQRCLSDWVWHQQEEVGPFRRGSFEKRVGAPTLETRRGSGHSSRFRGGKAHMTLKGTSVGKSPTWRMGGWRDAKPRHAGIRTKAFGEPLGAVYGPPGGNHNDDILCLEARVMDKSRHRLNGVGPHLEGDIGFWVTIWRRYWLFPGAALVIYVCWHRFHECVQWD